MCCSNVLVCFGCAFLFELWCGSCVVCLWLILPVIVRAVFQCLCVLFVVDYVMLCGWLLCVCVCCCCCVCVCVLLCVIVCVICVRAIK